MINPLWEGYKTSYMVSRSNSFFKIVTPITYNFVQVDAATIIQMGVTKYVALARQR